MPKVRGKKYPYTKAGMAAAKAARKKASKKKLRPKQQKRTRVPKD